MGFWLFFINENVVTEIDKYQVKIIQKHIVLWLNDIVQALSVK